MFFLVALTVAAGVAEAQAIWQPVPGFTTRQQSATAYDAARGLTILFGGNDGALRDDTWQWDGASWVLRVPATRPVARDGHLMVYDHARQRVLLFGGSTAVGDSTQLWSWDGDTWALLAPAHAPLQYANKAMVYDVGRDRVVLYGGSGGSYGGLWEYDGVDWTQAPFALPNWPLSDDNIMLAYDPVAGNTALCRATPSATVMWRWNGVAWSSQAGPGFYRVLGGRMLFDPVRRRLLLVSGAPINPANAATVYEWNPASATWLALATDGPAGRHSTCYDSVRDRVVVVGGTAVGTPADSSVWEWDGAAWSRRTFAPPLGRDEHSMVRDIANDRLILYGGRNLADTWVRAQGNWQLVVPQPTTTTPTHPGQLQGFRLVHDEARDQTLLVAGDPGFPFWRLAGNQWLTMNATTPPARTDPGVVYDRARQRVVMFGGRSGSINRNDMWIWNGAAWTQIFPVHVPQGRTNPGMAYDPVRDRIVLLGGIQASGLPSDTWEYDGADWMLRSSGAVTGSQAPRLAYDEVRQNIVALVSPNVGAMQTWQWDGVFWSLVSPGETPSLRFGASLVGTATEVLMFGGRANSPPTGAMWALATPQPARVASFGGSGSSSAGPLELHLAGALPWIGSRCQLTFGPLPGVPLPGLWVGLSRTLWQGQQLPIDLGFAGYPASVLRIALDGPWAVRNDGRGNGLGDVDVPSAAALIGVELFFQAFVYEPGAAALTTSNGLALTLGVR